VKFAPIPYDRAVDTLAIARRKFPGSPASLDALCRRFGIDNSSRTLHGALLDSEILAEVYLELIGGKQPDFALNVTEDRSEAGRAASEWRPQPRPTPLASRLSENEKAAHAAFVEKLGDAALWKRF
jgi:DNA polymerase-3 subunit epsilon